VARIKISVPGTVGRSVLIDTNASSKLAALTTRVAALESRGAPSTLQHRNLQGLQIGDDHPQYAMWQAPETITATWNFAQEPDVEGVPLTEFIQDAVGLYVSDTPSIAWTYDDPGGALEADIDQSFAAEWTANHGWADGAEVQLGAGNDLRLYHNGTDSFIENDTGNMWIRMVTSVLRLFRDGGNAGIGWYQADGTTLAAALQTIEADGNFNYTNFISGGHIVLTTSGAGHIRVPRDNSEVQVGAGQDLRLYHDGTNSWVRNDTGILKLSVGANVALQFNTSRAFGVDGANYGNSGDVLTSAGSGSPPSWAAPSAGSGLAIVQVANLVITSNNVLQDTDLILALTAGTWLITFDTMQTQNSTPQMEVQLQYTGTVTSVAGAVFRMRGNGTAFSNAAFTAMPFAQTETTSDTVFRRGSVRLTVSDGGNVKFQARQVTSSATSVTFLAGSSMKAVRIS
jgi:hypothetical protein